MKAKVLGLNGSVIKEVELAPAFEEAFRPDLIRKAVSVFQSNRRQPYGASPTAGVLAVAVSLGTGRGTARVPRLHNGSAAFSPNARGGRRAHPPRAERVWDEKINQKERAKAFKSSLAAAANKDRVIGRGHTTGEHEFPLVVEDSLETITRTKNLISTLEALDLYDDVASAKERQHIRAGRGRNRGRKYKTPRSLLIVTSSDAPVLLAANNLTGVDVVDAHNLNVEHLAPGGDAGRLTLFTEKALAEIAQRTARRVD